MLAEAAERYDLKQYTVQILGEKMKEGMMEPTVLKPRLIISSASFLIRAQARLILCILSFSYMCVNVEHFIHALFSGTSRAPIALLRMHPLVNATL